MLKNRHLARRKRGTDVPRKMIAQTDYDLTLSAFLLNNADILVFLMWKGVLACIKSLRCW